MKVIRMPSSAVGPIVRLLCCGCLLLSYGGMAGVRALVGDFLSANGAIPEGGPSPVVTLSGWTKRFSSDGKDVCV